MPRYAIIPGRSRVWADARSSLHPIHLETAGFEGYLEIEPSEAGPRLGASAHIELPVELLKANNLLLDGELQRRLEARKYPAIKGDLREARPQPGGKWQLKGDLTLHGVKRQLEVEVTLRAASGETVELEGTKAIDMRDFGLDPPKLLFLKVDPEVRVRALLVARPA